MSNFNLTYFITTLIILLILFLIYYKLKIYDTFEGSCPKIEYTSGQYVISINNVPKKTFQNKTDAVEAWQFIIQNDLSLLTCSLSAIIPNCNLSTSRLIYDGSIYTLEVGRNDGIANTKQFNNREDAIALWNYITEDNPDIKNCTLEEINNTQQGQAQQGQQQGTQQQGQAQQGQAQQGTQQQGQTQQGQTQQGQTQQGTQQQGTQQQGQTQQGQTQQGTQQQGTQQQGQTQQGQTQQGTQQQGQINQNQGQLQNNSALNQYPQPISQNANVISTQLQDLSNQLNGINDKLLKQSDLQASDHDKLNNMLDIFNKNINDINSKNSELKNTYELQDSHIAKLSKLEDIINKTPEITPSLVTTLSQTQVMAKLMANNEPVIQKKYSESELKLLHEKLSQSRVKIAENDYKIYELTESLKRANQNLKNNKVIIEDIQQKLHTGIGNASRLKIAQSLNKYTNECPKCPVQNPRPLYSTTYPVNVMEIERQGYGSILK